jgi:hypothetical protein
MAEVGIYLDTSGAKSLVLVAIAGSPHLLIR